MADFGANVLSSSVALLGLLVIMGLISPSGRKST